MASARPLRDVFADLAGAPNAAADPAALLREQGHAGLPDELVAQAVVSYADTAPVEVAEHLAPYVTAHSGVGAEPALDDLAGDGWLDLMGTAPAGPEPGAVSAADLDFGTGAGPVDAIEPDDSPEDFEELDEAEPAEWAPDDSAWTPAELTAEDDPGDGDDEPGIEPLG